MIKPETLNLNLAVLIVLIIPFLALFSSPKELQQEIGIVNVESVLASMPEHKRLLSQLNDMTTEMQNSKIQHNLDIERIKNRRFSKNDFEDAKVRAHLLDKESRQYQKYYSGIQKEYRRIETENFREIKKRVSVAITQVGEEKKLSYILNTAEIDNFPVIV